MESLHLLTEKNINSKPWVQFDYWYKEHASAVSEISESVTLATASASGRVSARTVLLRGHGEKGFIFFTNYNSRKVEDLFANPQAALLFYWKESGRQVRIEGRVEKISSSDSSSYFSTRPRESQISVWASEQSRIIPDRSYLQNRFTEFSERFKGRQVDRPDHWGGYILIPDWFEFWQSGEFRLHNRICFNKNENGWELLRLAP